MRGPSPAFCHCNGDDSYSVELNLVAKARFPTGDGDDRAAGGEGPGDVSLLNFGAADMRGASVAGQGAEDLRGDEADTG